MIDQINIDNYEAYFLDYIEGNLSDLQVQQLNQFLDQNPELKIELDEFENFQLVEPAKEDIVPFKQSLKREETTGLLESDYLMIAQIENTISIDEKNRLSEIVADNSSLVADLSLYHKTILPKEELSIDSKEGLYQKEDSKIIWWPYAAAASILALVFLNWYPVNQKYQPNTFGLVEFNSIETDVNAYAFILKEEIEPVKKSAQEPTLLLNEPIHQEAIKKVPQELIENTAKTDLAESIEPKIIPSSNLKEAKEEESIQAIEKPIESVTQNESLANNNISEFTPINEYAKNKIQSNLIKGKTFSEDVIEELKTKAKEKLNLETEINENGDIQTLAFNIGKLSFSRSK